MKVQWSLRTLLIVMTLGGPLLAVSVDLATRIANYLSSFEEVHTGCHISHITWQQAMREAQQVEQLSKSFREADQHKLAESQGESAKNSLQSPAFVD